MKYQELAAVLQENIDAGIYHESGKLPTEDSLIQEYGVTRYCVRNAVNKLVETGSVYPVQGSGMFVRESNRENFLSMDSTRGLCGEFGRENVKTRVVRLELIEAGEELAGRMKCPEGTPIYEIVRLRIINGQNYAVEYNYYKKEVVRYMNKEIAEGSLYQYIRQDLGLTIGFSDKIIYSDKLDQEAAGLLALAEGEPALIVQDDVYLSNGHLFDVSKVVYNYKYAKFFTITNMK